MTGDTDMQYNANNERWKRINAPSASKNINVNLRYGTAKPDEPADRSRSDLDLVVMVILKCLSKVVKVFRQSISV